MSAVAVSVVMPAFNAAETIVEAVESILAEDAIPLELLVVDDGSTDNTRTLCQQLAARDPRLRVLGHPGDVQRGVGPSRQLAIERARGHAIAFLDADDLALPGRLPFQLDLLERHPRAVLVHGAMQAFGSPESLGRHLEAWMSLGEGERVYRLWRRYDALWYNRIANSSVLVRRSCLARVRIPSLRYQYEDWATWLLLGRWGPFVFHPRAVVRYRLHPASFTARHHGSGALGHLRASLEMLQAVERGLGATSARRLRVRGRRLLVAAALAVGSRLEPSARVSASDQPPGEGG